MPSPKAPAKRPKENTRRSRTAKKPRPARPEPLPRAGGTVIPRGASASASEFPVAENLWCRFFDDRLPYWVKQTYAPERYKADGAFNDKDALFFSAAVKKLSDLYIGRSLETEASAYFEDARLRSAYLLYFLPLQAAKFVRLFNIHAAAIRSALAAAEKKGVFRIADLGSGPATATLGLLTWLVAEYGLHRDATRIPPVEIHLLDTDAAILKDGAALIEEFRRIYGIAPDRVRVHSHTASLSDASHLLPEDVALTLIGNVFNEGLGIHEQSVMEWMPKSLGRSIGGGILFVEPAAPENAAFLSTLRNRLLQSGAVPRDAAAIWGPCLHAQACPLAQSRDWCHFSAPGGVPGRWFKVFSETIGTERQWVKFSYLWLAAPGSLRRLDKTHGTLRRVISGPMPDRSGSKTLLICEPEKPGRATAPNRPPVGRGDLVTVRPLRKKRSFGERER